MYKLILLILVMASLCFAQGFANPTSLPPQSIPFPTGSDTLINADTLASRELNVGKLVGAVILGLQFQKISGTSAVVKVYYQMYSGGLNWGVPWDSVAVSNTYGGYKMIRIADIDSTNVANQVPAYIDLSSKDWWRFHDAGRLVLITGSHTGKILTKGRVRGQ